MFSILFYAPLRRVSFTGRMCLLRLFVTAQFPAPFPELLLLLLLLAQELFDGMEYCNPERKIEL